MKFASKLIKDKITYWVKYFMGCCLSLVAPECAVCVVSRIFDAAANQISNRSFALFTAALCMLYWPDKIYLLEYYYAGAEAAAKLRIRERCGGVREMDLPATFHVALIGAAVNWILCC